MDKKTVVLMIILAAVFLIFVAYEFASLDVAHSSFDNYYKFRGCTQLVNKTDAYGYCQTGNGQLIEIVQFDGRWYLAGDLPTCYFNICF